MIKTQKGADKITSDMFVEVWAQADGGRLGDQN